MIRAFGEVYPRLCRPVSKGLAWSAPPGVPTGPTAVHGDVVGVIAQWGRGNHVHGDVVGVIALVGRGSVHGDVVGVIALLVRALARFLPDLYPRPLRV